MNDKILNLRQRGILTFLEKKGEISSTKIHELFGRKEGVARLTIIRDLKKLIDIGLVQTKGKARSTTYGLKNTCPLLSYVNIDEYFSLAMSERGAFKEFQKSVFSNMKHLFSKSEIDILQASSTEFKNRMKLFDSTLFKREFERFIIEFSWKSSQIEGNTYDLLETEALIKMQIEAEGHSAKEAAMILNHKAALDEVMVKPSVFKKLTIKKVVKLHNLLVKDLDVSTGIRDRAVRITGTSYIPSQGQKELMELLKKIIEKINETPFPPEKALIAGSMIAYLQPFADGNKRTARILANAILLAYGYFPLSYRNINPVEYVKAMILFYEQNNLYHLKRIFSDQMHFSVENYFIV